MADSTSYSYADVTATINGTAIRGLWEGDDAIVIEEGTDIGTGLIGADGSGMWSQHVNKSATITINLQHTSPTHRYLTTLLAQQRESNLAGAPFTLNDRRSNEGGTADKCFIQQAASTGKGVNANQRTWRLWTAEYERSIPNG